MRLFSGWKERIKQDEFEGEMDAYRHSEREQAWRIFVSDTTYTLSFPPRANIAVSPDLTKEFLGHAKLYCLTISMALMISRNYLRRT